MMDVLDLLRLRSLHASGELVALQSDQGEESAIHAIADALLGTDVEKKEAIIRGFLQESDFDGIPCMYENTQLPPYAHHSRYPAIGDYSSWPSGPTSDPYSPSRRRNRRSKG